MTKEEKEQRKLGLERERQAEIDAILERSLQTRPPSDVDLRARLSQEPLGFPTVVSSGEGLEQGDSSVLPQDPAENSTAPSSVPRPQSDLPTPVLRPPPELLRVEQEPVEESNAQKASPRDLPAAVLRPRRGSESERHMKAIQRMYTTSDSSVEFVLDEVAKAVRSRRRSPGVNISRVPVLVSAEAFNRVSYASFARRLDKIEVLTYLLEKYVPSGRPESAPGWLVKTDLETEEKTRHLSYARGEHSSKIEGEEARKEDLEERFWWLQGRFSVHKVDVIESIIMKHLPAAPFETSPKPRRKTVNRRDIRG
jgi:hypothetical protein